ncbi:MAG TPA: ATP-binding protein [Rhodospirillales bacterium]
MFAGTDPFQAFLAGAVVVALLSFVAILRERQRISDVDSERRRMEAVAVKAREMLAAAPDGLFLWDGANGGFTCSRRLAVLLDLEAGTQARYDDVRACFEGESLKALEHAVSRLRAGGTPFDLLLNSGRRRIQAIGARAETETSEVLAEMVWMRDITGVAGGGRVASVNTSGLDDRHLTALLDAMPLPVWLRDSDLGIAFVNRAGRDVATAEAEVAAEARREGKPVSERRHVKANGSERLLEFTETPLGTLGGGGDPATGGTIGYAVDRTETEAVSGQAERVAVGRDAILHVLDSAVAIFDSDAALTYANKAYADLWQLDSDWLRTGPGLGEILEKLREQRRLPEVTDFRQFKLRQLAQFETLGEPVEELLHLPDGRTVRNRVARQGKDGLVFAYDDVSDRLDLERSVKSLDAVQRETLDNLHEGIAVFGSDGRLKLSNPVFAAIWNLKPEDLTPDFHVGDFVQHTRALIPVEGGWDDLSWGVHKEKVVNRLINRRAGTGRIELAGGTVVDYANVPLPDGAMLLSYLDVTDTTRVEQALRQRAQALTEADRLKSEFIAHVAYEVRTPLNTIIGFADMLRQGFFGSLNNRQDEYARGILDTGRGLMSVVGDILDLATIEAGRLELDRDTVEMHSLLVAALNLVQERARRKNLNLTFDCPPDIGWITADEKRLKQVVFNLLTNAVTFTPERGSVRLEARRDGDDVAITVADTGIGIPQADRDRVFRPFERGGNPGGDRSGAGLGLTLVKSFIGLHGGSVDVKSPPGRGTTITCRVPVKGPAADAVADQGED